MDLEIKTDQVDLDQSMYYMQMSLPTAAPFDMNRYQYQQNYPDSPTLNESFGSGSSSTLSFESADLNMDNPLVSMNPTGPQQTAPVIEVNNYDHIESWRQHYGPQPKQPDHDLAQHSYQANRICLVCNDAASGQHYGVPSCEACKAFFKRTVQGAIDYTCPSNNDCLITKRRRKACQSCRFEKCIRVGMLREGVRLDRVRGGRQKYRRATTGPYQRPDVMGGQQITPKIYELNNVVSQLLQAERKVSPSHKVKMAKEQPTVTLGEFSTAIRDRLLNLISWAKSVPGFSEMTLSTQTQALRSGWLDSLSLDLAFYSQPPSSAFSQNVKLVITNDFVLTLNNANSSPMLTKLLESSRKLLLALAQAKLTSGEFVLMKGLFLFSTVDPIETKYKLLGTRVMRMFSDYCSQSISEGEENRFGSLLLLSSSIRELALNIRETLFSANCTDPLVNELLRSVAE